MKEQVQDYKDSTKECNVSKYYNAHSARVMIE